MAGVAPPTYQGFVNAENAYLGNTTLRTLGSYGGYGQPYENEPLSNAPFDSRWTRIKAAPGAEGAFTSGVRVTGGEMSTQFNGTKSSTVFKVFFQFNPNEIDLAYTFDDSVIGALNPQYYNNGALSAAGLTNSIDSPQGLMLNQQISFTLMFDRTYEVWTGTNMRSTYDMGSIKGPKAKTSYDTSQGPYIYGAQWDVWAIERMVGIFGQASGQGPNGPPASSIIHVQFGSASTDQGGVGGVPITSSSSPGTAGVGNTSKSWHNGGRALGFTGWMTGLEAAYTRFDASMVPTRAAVQLTFERVFSLQSIDSTPAAPGSGSSGSKNSKSTPALTKAQTAALARYSYLPGSSIRVAG